MFTPIETALGALLLHHSTTTLLYNNGAVLGASGLIRRLLTAPTLTTGLFFAGMSGSAGLMAFVCPELLPSFPGVEQKAGYYLFTVLMGLLTGWGTKGCNGCTSGHMLCGMSRFSGRSILATAIFFPTAFITYFLSHRSGIPTAACPAGQPCFVPVYPSQALTQRLLLLALGTILATNWIPRWLSTRSAQPTLPNRVTYLLSGFTFGLGLLLSGMGNPDKVQAFFSIYPIRNWDPSLLVVVLCGLVPNSLYNLTFGLEGKPKFEARFQLPTKSIKDSDWKFVLGAMTFGISWGLTGTCPGPAALRTVLQPAWGVLWMAGFWLGSIIG
ncbi:hypothetical protein P152DRAFT_170290 [Eremomyces bilateralis CBS 781.70]|uniref:YeeE/YedE family integral membrane protein n=1 Tax=Eremomyces bilateralis CBS 781.70 TaxID=1392243 RepID=A0A6G1FTT1_9PEZI|nr:uncharacterized protein P152DRAFT_170290 [Eremomyces bilateralis CBS 781.70]KAF1809126.1 hypothetical protein P152DRAFT_170290 [Eremomyces bilateralis CBS 781.70]